MTHTYVRRVIGILVALIISTAALAHNGMIRGAVTVGATNHPLQNVVVTVEGTPKSVLTDALGRFALTGLQEGPATITFAHIGYATDTQYVVVSETQLVELNIPLERSEIGG